MTLIVLAAWLPATAHCQLEAVGIIAMDECCETTDKGSRHSDSSCSDVEGAGYKTECAAALPVPAHAIEIVIDLCVIACEDVSNGIDVTESGFRTHHLPQFVMITAQPIRGPSVLS